MRAGSSNGFLSRLYGPRPQLLELASHYLLKLAHDGLEREFRCFNWLDAGVCATCAPGDLEESIVGKCEAGRFGLI